MEGHWGSKAVFEHRTVSNKLVNMKRKNRNKSSVPKPTIGASPKAQSASSQRVQGLQLATVTAETSMSRQKKRRTRHRAKERNELGTILCDPYDKKKAIALAQERRPGSWMLPTSSKGKAEFCVKEAKTKVVPMGVCQYTIMVQVQTWQPLNKSLSPSIYLATLSEDQAMLIPL